MFAQMLTSNQASISKITQQSYTNKLKAAAAQAAQQQHPHKNKNKKIIYSVKEEITQQFSQEQIKTTIQSNHSHLDLLRLAYITVCTESSQKKSK